VNRARRAGPPDDRAAGAATGRRAGPAGGRQPATAAAGARQPVRAPADGAPALGAPALGARPLRLARLARQLSQEQLAVAAGVSRQAVAGFESGRFDPSLSVALRLAAALGRSVEDLFGVPDQPSGWQARWAVPPPSAAPGAAPPPPVRVAVVEVGGCAWAFPLVGPAGFASGMVVANGQVDHPDTSAAGPVGAAGPVEAAGPVGAAGQEAPMPERVTGADDGAVAAVSVLRQPRPTVVVAGCDPALALLAGPLGDLDPPVSVLWWPCSSRVALALAAAGAVHVAGVHRPRPDRRATVGAARRALGDAGGAVVGFAAWAEGVAVDPAYADRVRTVGDLVGLPGVFANREEGAEARQLVQTACQLAGTDPRRIPGWSSALAGHVEVAHAVAGGVAAAGVTTAPVAAAFGLPFLALADEEFELVVPRRHLAGREVQQLVAALGGAGLREQLAALAGYDISACGDVVATF